MLYNKKKQTDLTRILTLIIGGAGHEEEQASSVHHELPEV
jgi:hypothetical protein